MYRSVIAIFFALSLVACSSAVKLDEVKVEDKSALPVASSGSNTGDRRVSAEDITGANAGNASGNTALAADLRVIYFDYDSYSIKPEFQTAIEANAKYLKANKSRKISIEGHTDERGGREYNLALGQSRAEAVRRAFMVSGVSDDQMEAVSFGKEKPAAQGNSEAAMQKNRRAEIVYR